MADITPRRKRDYKKVLQKVDKHGMSDEMVKKVCSVIEDKSHSPCTGEKAGGKCLLNPVYENGKEKTGQKNEVQEFFGDCYGMKNTEDSEQCFQKTTCFCDLRNVTIPLTQKENIDCMCKQDNKPKNGSCPCKYYTDLNYSPCECNSFYRVQCYGTFNVTNNDLSLDCKTKLNATTSFEKNLPCCFNKFLLQDFSSHNSDNCSHITTTVAPTTAVLTTPKKMLEKTTSTASKTHISGVSTNPELKSESSVTHMVPISTASSGFPSGDELINSSGTSSKQTDTWMDIYNPVCIATPIGLILIFVLLFLARRFYVKRKDQRSHEGAERFY